MSGGLAHKAIEAAQKVEIMSNKVSTKQFPGLSFAYPEPFQSLGGIMLILLYDNVLGCQVNEIQAVAEDLPALLLRLKTLETVHLEVSKTRKRVLQLDVIASWGSVTIAQHMNSLI